MTPIPADLSLETVGRHPTRLCERTVQAILHTPLPEPRQSLAPPRISIVFVTYNQVAFTRLCLLSILDNTPTVPEYEVITVDNASSDGTREFLERTAAQHTRVRLIGNATNRGFACAVNQGLDAASGEVLVILNNDTLVSTDWLSRLTRYLADSRVGLVGPVTNAAPNEAQIECDYQTYSEFQTFAEGRAYLYARQCTNIPMLTMFCVAMRRETYRQVGALDERFGIGTFEDDDYSRRAREAGYAVVCAEDVFVHHFGQASFGALVPSGEYAALLEANRRRFEQKWSVTWSPHRHRPGEQYLSMVERIRRIVDDTVPADATILVTTRGDAALLDLGARRCSWHFPRLADGAYAGFYPADSAAAIAHLEELRVAGADHMLVPRTAHWWLDHYTGLRDHLERQYFAVIRDPEACWIYDLRGRLPL